MTTFLNPYYIYTIYFNSHAHVERDSSEQSSFIISSNFNSHAHVERDHLSLGNFQPSYISTHTLTWSVTWGFEVPIIWDFHFNSHAHVERDLFIGH